MSVTAAVNPPDPFAPLPTVPDHAGVPRRLGNFPSAPAARVFASLSLGPAGPPRIPEAEWQEFDEWPAAVTIKDQGSYGACFPAGTRVRMADGTERNIEDVRLLDRVLTAEGNLGRVVRTMVRDADDGLVRLSLWGHTHLKATAEHPVLTARGYVPAGKLTLDDWVALPRYAPASNDRVYVAAHLPARVMITRAGRGKRNFNAPEGRAAPTVILTPVPDLITLTPGVGRVFGLFLAEGRTDQGKVTWTFNKTEETTLVADLVTLLRDEWGLESHLQFRPNNSINVVVYGSAWAKLFESLCANGSGSKRLHPDLAAGPRPFLASLLDGWLDGDGHARRTDVTGVTISRNLALGMYDAAQALGRRPSIRRYQSPTYGTVKHRHARWEVSMGGTDADTYRCRMDDTHVWRKVRGVEREDFDGPVFNLEVEGDNSYVAEGVGVHNCNGHAAALSLELARHAAGYPHVPLSAWWVYGNLTGGWDVGSNPMDALKLVTDTGCAPESDVPWGMFSPKKFSAASKSDAPRYRAELSAVLTDPDELMTAVQLRRPVNGTVHVGWGFNSLDADGCPGLSRGMDNHAITLAFGAKKTATHGWMLKMANSWTTGWGWKGFCWVPLSYFCRNAGCEYYALAAAAADPQDGTNPPAPR